MHVITICTADVDDDGKTTGWVNMNLASASGVTQRLGARPNITFSPTKIRFLTVHLAHN